ncbi:hypothetical protein Amsp01_081660 [Amycolatopsis sp. NBRC 101858]|uniref:hypothetical protein n=1 Tax=Amycolatopsis sp. NBRC 101858 TaxID=3032200 RepID=UPI0024A50D88|nr:hypothetical protein [Amycolatopsis sp. NBRC 101858]GLY42143.1 hypothetical protein Amsp01_081660 [Amycolatopsis sp. NBRC 101858]
MGHDDGPGRRVLAGPGGAAADVLAALPGADLTTVQLEVARRRAARLAPADVLRRHRDDRFVAASPLPFASLRRVEDAILAAAASFDLVALAPVVPLGTHSAVTGLAQHRVVPTGRGTEVAADPTTGLALEAAVRRSGSSPVRLATVQRVVRAQRVDRAGLFAHFSLFGAVTAGRDTGAREFERAAAAEHARLMVASCRALGATAVSLGVTVLDPRFEGLLDEAGVPTHPFPEREGGRGGYYEGLCFKVYASFGGELTDVGDGGFTPWTRRLLGNAKERLMTSGLGVDRLATLLPA